MKNELEDIKKIELICQSYDLNNPESNSRLYKELRQKKGFFLSWVGCGFVEELGNRTVESRRRVTLQRCCKLFMKSFLLMAVVLGMATFYLEIERQKENAVLNYIKEERDAIQKKSIDVSERIKTDDEAEDILAEYIPLYRVNEELVGWLNVDGTNIDHPVMQKQTDEEFYLQHNFRREEDAKGALFLSGSAGINPRDNVLVVFGHNMRDGSMFGDLDKYLDKTYWSEHPTFEFDTLYETGLYQVAAVLKTRVLRQEEEGFRYYDFEGYESEEQFAEFMEFVKENQVYETGIELEYEDEIVMLSTCEYTVENGRLVVVGRKIK